MIKAVIFQVLGILGLFIASKATDVPPPPHWMDLDIISQIRIISGLSFMVVIGIAGSVIFRSVWIRDGYAGTDKVLVDTEVALFISHVLAFFLLEIFFYMIVFINYVQPPQYAFWICAGGFLSPEIVRIIHIGLEKLKIKKV